MKKVMIIITAVLMLSIVLGISRKPFHQQQETHLDTLMFLGDLNDTMYFVVNGEGDTIDWFTYWDGRKLDRKEMDYLYNLPDSFRK